MAKILLAEDNEVNSDMLSRRLVRRGFEVVLATDGQQAVDFAKRENPDLIVLDIGLPIMDGYQAARLIKAAPECRGVPILGLSAHAMTGDREKALAAGCDDYDTKPIDMPRLLGKIDALMKVREPT
jgi:CheY-like chemotaxis protein